MGNELCRCREGKKPYTVPVQANDEEITKKVLTNTGNVQETVKVNGKNTSIEGSVTKAETKKPSPKDDGHFKDNPKKATVDKDGKRKSEDENSSEESSSESSSSTSDSSDDGRTRKKYSKKKSNGGVSIVSKSKKTVYNGPVNKINLGNMNNTTINITESGIKVKSADTRTTEVDRERPSSREEEKPLHHTTSGCFIQLHGKNKVEPTLKTKVLAGWSNSVCQIRWNGGTASGFRVGPQHIMTALHVVELITREVIQLVGQPDYIDDEKRRRLARGDVYAVFNYETEGYQTQERNKFYFKDVIHFQDKYTDSVVLELKSNDYGTELPPPFAYFSVLQNNLDFKLVGHDGNKPKASHNVDNKENVSEREIQIVREKCEEIDLRFEFEPFAVLNNPDRYLFHSIFTKGASGSPGLVTDGVHVAVVTMLVHGYPDGFYNENEDPNKKAKLPENFRVEQGANMESIYKRMKESNPALCSQIFPIEH